MTQRSEDVTQKKPLGCYTVFITVLISDATRGLWDFRQFFEVLSWQNRQIPRGGRQVFPPELRLRCVRARLARWRDHAETQLVTATGLAVTPTWRNRSSAKGGCPRSSCGPDFDPKPRLPRGPTVPRGPNHAKLIPRALLALLKPPILFFSLPPNTDGNPVYSSEALLVTMRVPGRWKSPCNEV
jgi:hypothetical protein